MIPYGCTYCPVCGATTRAMTTTESNRTVDGKTTITRTYTHDGKSCRETISQ